MCQYKQQRYKIKKNISCAKWSTQLVVQSDSIDNLKMDINHKNSQYFATNKDYHLPNYHMYKVKKLFNFKTCTSFQ